MSLMAVRIPLLIWGQVNSNFRGFQGLSSICCSVKDRQGICLSKDQGSCGGQNLACLLYKVKERWINAGFPITQRDDHIILKITALKKKFDMNKKKFDRKTAKEEEKLAFKQKFNNTTFSLAPVDWKQRIMADSFLTSATNRERVNVLLDYVGDEETLPTRFVKHTKFVSFPQGASFWCTPQIIYSFPCYINSKLSQPIPVVSNKTGQIYTLRKIFLNLSKSF